MAWVDLMPKACSRGATKVWNMSKIKPLAFPTIWFSCGFTKVVNTIGGTSYFEAAWLMLETASWAFFGAIHKRNPNVLKSGLKLRQNRLTEVFSSNSSAVRNNKNNAGLGGHQFGLSEVVSTTIWSYWSMPHFMPPLDQFSYLKRVFYVQPTATK